MAKGDRLTEKQEAFVQALVARKKRQKAYKTAYPKAENWTLAAVEAEAKRAGDKEAELGEAIATEKGRIDAFFASAEIGEAAIDTLKEIQAEIASDNEGAAAMAASIQQNKAAIEAEVKRATAKEGELAKAVTDEATARDNADKAHTEAINGINGKI